MSNPKFQAPSSNHSQPQIPRFFERGVQTQRISQSRLKAPRAATIGALGMATGVATGPCDHKRTGEREIFGFSWKNSRFGLGQAAVARTIRQPANQVRWELALEVGQWEWSDFPAS